MIELTSEQINLLLESAIRAPSSHNSQPWLFKVGVGRESIEIHIDPRRRLSEADPSSRLLYVSLGCVMANLMVAADFIGLAYRMEYFTAYPSNLAVRMNFLGKKQTSRESVFRAIQERRSNRNRYKNTAMPAKILNELREIVRGFGSDLRVDFIEHYIQKERVADISSRAMAKIMARDTFRKELASWLRINWSRKKDGMPGSGHGMSLITSIIAPYILRHIDVSRVEAQKERTRILNFPIVAIISSKKNIPSNWLRAGELLEMILLTAQSHSIDSTIRVAAIEEPKARDELRQALCLSKFQTQMLFGLGYAEKTAPHSPRRRLKDFIM